MLSNGMLYYEESGEGLGAWRSGMIFSAVVSFYFSDVIFLRCSLQFFGSV